MIYSLERLQRGEKLRLDAEVLPPDLPLQFSGLEEVGGYVLPLLGFSVTRDHLQVLLVVVIHLDLLLLILLVPSGSSVSQGDDHPVAELVETDLLEDAVFAAYKQKRE